MRLDEKYAYFSQLEADKGGEEQCERREKRLTLEREAELERMWEKMSSAH